MLLSFFNFDVKTITIKSNISRKDPNTVIHFIKVTTGVIAWTIPDSKGYLAITIVAPIFSKKSKSNPIIGSATKYFIQLLPDVYSTNLIVQVTKNRV